jgi:hypothetical protein
MASSNGDAPDNSRKPIVLSIKTDAAGLCVLSSSDERMGGTLLNRHAALREVEDRICVTNRVTVVVIRPGK